MKALVVYESMYGNTHAIAEAVARGLESAAEVSVCSADRARPADVADADLLVVGGPTHVHGLSSSRSRRAAREDAEQRPTSTLDPAAGDRGLRTWLSELRVSQSGGVAAAFDTRLPGRRSLTGSAAKGIARRLRRLGYRVVAEPESFLVEHGEGPLRTGELERAEAWGSTLAMTLEEASVR